MEREKLERLLIDYIDDLLDADDRAMVERELISNAEARKLYEELRELIQVMEQSATLNPSDQLKQRFDTMLREESDTPAKSTIIFRPAFYRVAAAITLLILGGGIGFWISQYSEHRQEMAKIEADMEITRRQLAETKSMVLGMLDNERSASQRIKGVNVALGFSDADDEIVKALLNTMHTDPNTNVRLAALDALTKFEDDPVVKKALIASLPKQNDPRVQISLIQLMVQMKEKEVVKDLRQIVNDVETVQAVKDEAYTGILKLS